MRFYVGFHADVAGQGRNPDDVQIDGGLTINAKWADGMALNNYWRTQENLAIIPPADVPWQYTTRIALEASVMATTLRWMSKC